MALVALKASLKQNHLQMTSNGSKTCSNGSIRSKRPKIDPKFRPEWFPVAKVMPKTNSPSFSQQNSTKIGVAGVSLAKNSIFAKKGGIPLQQRACIHNSLIKTQLPATVTTRVVVSNPVHILYVLYNKTRNKV
jgi:hypothetical protein